MSQQGLALTGVDRVLPRSAKTHQSIPFAIRFHIHPDVRVSLSQGGGILLKLPNGEGWRFRSGSQMSVEEASIWAGIRCVGPNRSSSPARSRTSRSKRLDLRADRGIVTLFPRGPACQHATERFDNHRAQQGFTWFS